MPRILRKLKIGEVSSVSAGANPGARVTLMKRDDTNDRGGYFRFFHKIFSKAAPQRGRPASSTGVRSPISINYWVARPAWFFLDSCQSIPLNAQIWLQHRR
jgi:hypothetical protein